MRISDLAKATAVPIPTIKFYLREGLLPSGDRRATNQAEYTSEHVHRLRLIRALADIGGLPIAAIREVLAAIDDAAQPMHRVLGVAHRALAPQADEDEAPDDVKSAQADVDDFLKGLGWRISADAPGRRELAQALAVLRRLGWRTNADVFKRYARSADLLAAWELKQTPVSDSRAQTVEGVVIGTVVFEAVLVALRRLAQEHHSAARFPETTSTRQGSAR